MEIQTEMIYKSDKNPNSHLSVKERKWPSFPTKQLYSKHLIQGRTLDFGCGLGIDVGYLKEKGFDISGYDPYYKPDYPKGKFNTIICNYVLNVLLPEEQAHVLMAVSELLDPKGKAYFTVRRDIKRNGYRTHIKHKCKIYQCNVILPFKTIKRTDHCEIYEYRHYNQIKKNDNIDCPFCSIGDDKKLITESATVYAILDEDSEQSSKALIIPKKHKDSYFDLSHRLQQACWIVLNRVRKLLIKRFQPDGFNIKISVGEIAGQKINHTHIQLIPEYLK